MHRHVGSVLLLSVLYASGQRLCPVRVLSANVQSSFAVHALVDIDANSAQEEDGSRVQATFNNSGTINSGVFTGSPPTVSRCQFIFLGAPDEHVQLKFTSFEIVGANTTGRCEETNQLSVHVMVNSRMYKIQDFCGKELPPPVMSTKNLLTLEMLMKDQASVSHNTGFALHYAFMKGFGEQSKDAYEQLDGGVCSFMFNSSMRASGELWSPNHPGFYPRNLNCEYIFNGLPGQIVVIHFEYFDVEGYGQCDDSTHSDYVLFSNYKTVDRTNRRFCGSNRPLQQPIQSESSYFRMQFRTNEIFDATGFYVHYQFLDQPPQRKVVTGTFEQGCGMAEVMETQTRRCFHEDFQ